MSMRDSLLAELNDRFFSPSPSHTIPVRLNIMDDPLYTVPTLLVPSFRKIFIGQEAARAKANLLQVMIEFDAKVTAEEEAVAAEQVTSAGSATADSTPAIAAAGDGASTSASASSSMLQGFWVLAGECMVWPVHHTNPAEAEARQK
jgi:hypothetical protein